MFLGDAHRADVAVDGRGAHRDRGHVADDVAVVDRHVGRSRPDVHHGDALLLLLGKQHRLGGGQRVGVDGRGADLEVLERHFEPLERGLLAEDEVEGRGQLLAERSHGILHLPGVVDHVELGHALHDDLVVGRLHVAHAVEQGVDVHLAHGVLRIVDEDVVRMAGAPHEDARDAGAGFGDADAERRFGLRHGGGDRLFHQVDVVDLTGRDPFDGFRADEGDFEQALGVPGADGYHDVRCAQVDGDGIALLFHDAFGYFLQTTWSLYFTFIVLYSSQPISRSPRR